MSAGPDTSSGNLVQGKFAARHRGMSHAKFPREDKSFKIEMIDIAIRNDPTILTKLWVLMKQIEEKHNGIPSKNE